MEAPSRINFERLLKLKWGNILLPFFAVLNLLPIFLLRAGLPLDLSVMSWLSIVPGILVVFALAQRTHSRISWLTVASLGSALGLGVAPAIFSFLRFFDATSQTTLVVSIANCLLALICFFLEREGNHESSPYDFRKCWRVFWGSLLFVTLFLQFYNFRNIYFGVSGDLRTRGLFDVDLPYLVGQFASLKSWSTLRDLHQLALPMFYHDFAYIFIVTAAELTHHELFDLLIYVHPLFSYALFALSTYALTYHLTNKRGISAFAVGAMFLLGSFLGTEQGSSALSPSFVWGNVILLNALHLVAMLLSKRNDVLPRRLVYFLLAVLLLILSRSKITTFAALEAGLCFLIFLLALRMQWGFVIGLGVCVVIPAFVLLLLSREQSPFMPGGDFLIGAPLLGYANHLGTILHIPVSEINPVSSGFHLAVRQLLIIPYFVFHLARFVMMDGRLLLILIGAFLFRKRLPQIALPDTDSVFFWFLVSLMPIGFLFPVLYSPAWYPLAFSFYTPLVGIEVATILAVLIFFGLLAQKELAGRRVLLPIFGLLLFGCFVGNIRSILSEDSSHESKVEMAFSDGLRYLREHSQPHDVVATRRYNLSDTSHDESFFLYSAFSERPVISEGSSYGVLLGAVATIDTLKGLHRVALAEDTLIAHRIVLDSIYCSTDSTTVVKALGRYHASYILEDKAIHQHLALNPLRVADPFFDNSAMTIWKVRY